MGLLLARADELTPVYDGELPLGTPPLDETAKPPSPERWDDARSPEDLEAQRWGVVIPESADGDRLLALIAPLVEKRRADQGGHPVQVWRCPTVATEPEAIDWARQMSDPGARLRQDVPRYLLVLGDLDGVPDAVSRALAATCFVGRLAFRSDEGYAAYVEKVLRSEQRPRLGAAGPARFFTAHDGTSATWLGHQHLVQPVLALLRQKAGGPQGAEQARELAEVNGPEALLAAARDAADTVFFSLSHGLGAPRGGWKSVAEQQALQGGLSLGAHGRLTVEDVAGRAFLPRGVWFLLACYGAGTPAVSMYETWLAGLPGGTTDRALAAILASLPRPGERPFIAALPQAVLGSPDGPLAVIGHLDLAWTYAFHEPGGSGPRSAPYAAVVRALGAGRRVGVALRELTRAYSEAGHQLAALYEAAARGRTPIGGPERLARVWMFRHDVGGYVLLGDPAVRLASGEAPRSAEPAGDARPVDRPPVPHLEQAIAQLLLDDRRLEELARALGVTPARLQGWYDAYTTAGRGALD